MALKFDALGREIPDPTPVAIPVGFKRPESMQEVMRRMIREHMSTVAASNKAETFDEANDFDIPDEDPTVRTTSYQEMAEEFAYGGGHVGAAKSGRNGEDESDEGAEDDSGNDRSDDDSEGDVERDRDEPGDDGEGDSRSAPNKRVERDRRESPEGSAAHRGRGNKEPAGGQTHGKPRPSKRR